MDVVEAGTLASGSRMGGLAVNEGKIFMLTTQVVTYLMSLTCNDDSMQILQQLWSNAFQHC